MIQSDHDNYEVTLVQADNKWQFENDVNSGDAQDLYYSGKKARQYGNRFDDATTLPTPAGGTAASLDSSSATSAPPPPP